MDRLIERAYFTASMNCTEMLERMRKLNIRVEGGVQ